MIEVETAAGAKELTSLPKKVDDSNKTVYDTISFHLECMRVAPQKEYNKCLQMIIGMIPGNLVSLKDFDFGSMLEYVDNQGCSISHFTEKVEFMHLPGSILKKSLVEKFGNVMADCTAYLQLLTLAYCYNYCDNRSLCVTNASYMIGAMELYQPVIASPLRAKILYYANLTYEKYNEINDDYLGFLHRHLRFSHSAGDSSCVGQLLVLICRFYSQRKEFTTLQKFISTTHVIEAADCFNHIAFYNPDKSSQYARYSHYCGLLYMVLGQYDKAFNSLSEAMRAAPFKRASGFRSLTAKYLILVQLLRYETSLSNYYQYLKDGASAYALLGKTVSYGDMRIFDRFVVIFHNVYKQDGVINIVGRLRLAVNNRAMKTLLNSYSTITIRQIANKFGMNSDEDAHNAVAAYVRLNNIKGITIDCAAGIVCNSHQLADYGTYPSFELLHRRILAGAENCDMCLKKMMYDTKDYYNKMAHDSEDKLFIDDDTGAGGGNVMWMGKDDHDEGPDAGI